MGLSYNDSNGTSWLKTCATITMCFFQMLLCRGNIRSSSHTTAQLHGLHTMNKLTLMLWVESHIPHLAHGLRLPSYNLALGSSESHLGKLELPLVFHKFLLPRPLALAH